MSSNTVSSSVPIDSIAADEVTRADAHPLVARVRQFGADVLRPSLLQANENGVSPDTIQRLSELGALNHLAPAEYGGASISNSVDRRLHEVLAYSCFNTWLIWAQHEASFRRVLAASAENGPRSELADRILRGRVLLGSAASDVRHFPDRYIEARRTSTGWYLSGRISWVSGWGLSEAIAIAAVEATTQTVILALVPAVEAMRAIPSGLTVLAGSRTDRVEFRDVFLTDADVLLTESLAKWRLRQGTTDARSAAFGLAQVVIDELQAEDNPQAQDVAAAWTPQVARLRAAAYTLADADAGTDEPTHRGERAAIKAATGEALSSLTQALVVSRSGKGLTTRDTAQFYAGAAQYLLVQGPTPLVRQTQLTRLAEAVKSLKFP